MVELDFKKILLSNYNAEKHSFIYYLHERSEFNDDAFCKYYNAIIGLTQNCNYCQEILNAIFYNHNYILKSIIYHLNSDDEYYIKNLSKNKIMKCVELLENSYLGYINGKVYDDEMLNTNQIEVN